MRRQAKWFLALLILVTSMLIIQRPSFWMISIPLFFLAVVGLNDMKQTRHAIRRNFPLVGHFRYLFESIRPEINQYFIESNTDGMPINRENRSIVYQRAKMQTDSVPFGTKRDVYETGYECVRHSVFPKQVDPTTLRVLIGGDQCSKPYSTSIFNVSAMSYGALSSRAIESLNSGAKMGDFAHNSGEGGISSFHLKHKGDLIWQIGTGYFGCRKADGSFCKETFTKTSRRPEVKMIEIKLSQGAKPGLGGLLPGAKVTPPIAEARGVPVGVTIVSPAAHSAFSDFHGLMHFISELRNASDGKPVGIKLCVGSQDEVDQICEAMIAAQVFPDFITIDGAEGGTGAAPLEFTNFVGLPLTEGIIIMRNALVKYGLRNKMALIASGKVINGFDIVRLIALGADACASARGMMLALGCIQALRCNSNRCPAGVATQDPYLVEGLVVEDKSVRVAQYHKKTVESVAQIIGAMGLTHTSQVNADHVLRRDSKGEFKTLRESYHILELPDQRIDEKIIVSKPGREDQLIV